MKIFLSAYSCAPGRGSEAHVGWNVALEMANYHQVWVLTRAHNRSLIDGYMTQNPTPNLHFKYYDLPRWASWWKRGSRGVQLYYLLWQSGVYFVARRLHREVGFDLVHHVTFVKYWTPSFLALLPVPFLWGPVGGGDSAPRPFWRDFSLYGKLYETMRELARWLSEHDPFVRLTARRSALALAATEETAKRLRRLGAKNVHVFSPVGLSMEEIRSLAESAGRNAAPVRFVSLGNLLHLKGFHLGLRAFARAKLEGAEYWIIGEGPERARLEGMAVDLGIAAQTRFWGEIPREEALRKLGECHVLVHPSLHDTAPMVCLEAMAAGLPVICLDHGGPAMEVTADTGIRVSADDPKRAIRALSDAMVRLAGDPVLRSRMGEEGQRRVHEIFAWQTKSVKFLQFYGEVIDSAKLLATVEKSAT